MNKKIKGQNASKRPASKVLCIDIRPTIKALLKAMVIRSALYGVISPRLAMNVIQFAGLKDA
jgi:hypothetical protein